MLLEKNKQKPIEFFPKQLELIYSQHRYIVAAGGAGSGKSFATAEKIVALSMNVQDLVTLIVRKTRQSMTHTVIFELTKILRKELESGTVIHNKQDKVFLFKATGAVIFYAGMQDDKQRERIKSISADIIWAEEANELLWKDFELLQSRLRGTALAWGQQFILTTNPDAENHWINVKLILNNDWRKSGRLKYIHSTPLDNPALPGEYVEDLRDSEGVHHQRMFLGLWTTATGLVYEEYNPEWHDRDPFAIPDNWRMFRAVDWGYRAPASIQWWAEDPVHKHLFLVQEFYHTKKTDPELAAICNDLSEGFNRIKQTIVDHKPSAIESFRLAGVKNLVRANKKFAIAGKSNVQSGISLFKKRLLNAKLNLRRDEKDHLPSVFFFTDCLVEPLDPELKSKKLPIGIRQEMGRYVWSPQKNNRISESEEPVDDWNHSLDAARYLIAHIDLKQGRGGKWGNIGEKLEKVWSDGVNAF
jgi:phage terminase large subunit